MTKKIFYSTDIHGSDRCFRKFVNAGKFYGADILILGGDITGKAVVPIVKLGNNKYVSNFGGREKNYVSTEIDGLIKEIKFNGFYPCITDDDELKEIQADPEGPHKLFERLIVENITEWISLAEERLKPLGIRIYISPGNDDSLVVDDVINRSSYVINPEEKLTELYPGITMLSFGYSNPTPWNSPRELQEAEIELRLDRLAQNLDPAHLRIFNIHVPPIDTQIDQAPKLDASLKPIVEGGVIATFGAGSNAVRNIILNYQPEIGLHGHIHESAGAIHLGKTICINPGSEYSDGILRGTLITVDENTKKFMYQLTMG